MALTGRVAEVVAGSADAMFAVVTDIDRLPEWNAIIESVVERPATVTRDAEWVVQFHKMGQRWRSRSRVVAFDPRARHFAYRTQTDDGNPSYALWSWDVADDPSGARVSVSWEVNPKTFWRRALLGRIRNRQLGGEVRASIRAAERLSLASS